MSNPIPFPAAASPEGTGAVISRNVRILMASRGVSQMQVAAALKLSQGLTVLELRRFLGHSSAATATTQRYVLVRDQRIASATNRAASRFVA